MAHFDNEFNTKKFKKIQAEAAAAVIKKREEREKRAAKADELAMVWNDQLMQEGATFSNTDKKSLREGERKHGHRTPAGDNFPHGERGGHSIARTGEFRRAG